MNKRLQTLIRHILDSLNRYITSLIFKKTMRTFTLLPILNPRTLLRRRHVLLLLISISLQMLLITVMAQIVVDHIELNIRCKDYVDIIEIFVLNDILFCVRHELVLLR